jgi:anhydro-N-acetylmuramic acid kinase
MSGFFDLLKKKDRMIIGVLSGTSVDAVDTVLISVKGCGIDSKLRVLDFRSFPYNRDLKRKILEISDSSKGRVDDVCRMNALLGLHFGNCINKFIVSSGFTNADVDLIGSHGQTIHHLPDSNRRFGMKINSTLQIGDPSVIANVTGITTIGDFRMADIGAGGSGAPLVPYLDRLLFSHPAKSRLLVNIGGIANITYLPKESEYKELVAFDSGPGNMIIDYMMQKLFAKKFDKNGSIASVGEVSQKLLQFMVNNDDYFASRPPKSTGRERYGKHFSEMILRKHKKITKEDIIATVTEYTSFTIHHNAKGFEIDEVIVSGGGSNNLSLMTSLRRYFSEVPVSSLHSNGVNTANKEAVLFAVLANEAICGRKANIRNVTGARSETILGKICPI